MLRLSKRETSLQVEVVRVAGHSQGGQRGGRSGGKLRVLSGERQDYKDIFRSEKPLWLEPRVGLAAL
jgi:hypothetical protein